MFIGAGINIGPGITIIDDIVPSTYVTSGLQLFYDIGNSASYPGSGTNINDLSNNGRSGTLSGSPAYSSGGITTALGKYIYAPPAFNLGNAWTMTVVSNTSTTQPQYWATMWGAETWSSAGFIAYQTGSSSLSFGKPTGGTVWSTTQAAIQGNNTVWDFTYDGTTVALYKNGNSTPVQSAAMSAATASTYGIFFGARHVNGGGSTATDFSATTFYQMRVYNRALTTGEIATNYSSVKTAYPGLSLP